MTRKHYIATAQALLLIRDDANRRSVALELNHMFKRDNPRFDWSTFANVFNVPAR